MGNIPSDENTAGLGAAWSRLRRGTRTRTRPYLLVAFFYAWPLLWDHHQLASGSASAVSVLPAIAACFWFYGIVLARLAYAGPFGRSSLDSLATGWVLFMGYSIWLALFPPTGSKSALEWGAWLLVIAGLVAALVVIA